MLLVFCYQKIVILFHPWNNISLIVLNSQNYTNEINVWEIQWISQVKKNHKSILCKHFSFLQSSYWKKEHSFSQRVSQWSWSNIILSTMVGEMVQNSQSLFSFTFNALIDIHEYIYSHSTTEFTFKKYIYSHLPVYFLFTIIFAHIYEVSSFTFNELYPFTFTIEIFIQHFLRTTFAHRSV